MMGVYDLALDLNMIIFMDYLTMTTFTILTIWVVRVLFEALLKCAIQWSGARYVTASGITWMLQLYVLSFSFLHMVLCL